ncbi:STAS domain-containing protein [Puniceibacterium confluentis]|uniref:STAS domain-containing protein n=1 Tax=Puniceibacterium confluentis TaxID=1958944 RepID=UPI0011B84CEA|nr:STAS domain-containing protein [Puniceibacterium confluentis]
MTLNCRTVGDVQVILVEDARIDASVAIRFKDQMRELTATAPSRVVLDLHRVDFVDSSGLGAIVAAMKQLKSDQRLDLAGLTPGVDKVFRLTRMDSIFAIHSDLDAALAPAAR